MSGPRRHRPTSLHLGRPTALVAAMRGRRKRADGVRTGSGEGPLTPLDPADPASLRAIQAAKRLLDDAARGQNG